VCVKRTCGKDKSACDAHEALRVKGGKYGSVGKDKVFLGYHVGC
jgi:hypothetical protein